MFYNLAHYCKEFFSVHGNWAERMRMKGHLYPKKYLAGRQGHLDLYVIPAFGNCRPDEIKRRDIDNWLLLLKKSGGGTLAGPTKNKIMYTMGLVFEELRDLELISQNPVVGIKPFNKNPVQPRGIIEKDCMEKLFPASAESLLQIWGSPMWAAMMLVFRDTGSRPGEARALVWNDIDMRKRFIPFRKGVASGTADKIKETKTGSIKAGFLTAQTISALQFWHTKTPFRGGSDFVFSANGKKPISAVAVIRAFSRGLRRIGMADKPWTPYWLRHSFGTYQMETLNQEEIMKLMGHNAVTMTRSYQHPDNTILYKSTEPIKAKLDKAREAQNG